MAHNDKADLRDIAGVNNLKNGIMSAIWVELFKGRRKVTINNTLTEILEIGQQLDALKAFTSGLYEGSSWCTQGAKTEKKINTTQEGHKAQICFNCGSKEHISKYCDKPKNECGECHFLRGSHKKECCRRDTHSTSTSNQQLGGGSKKDKDPLTAIRGMDYEQMKAHFWYMKECQEKAEKGKGKAN